MRIQKALKAISSLAASAALLSGCATAGIIYEDVGHPPFHIIPRADANWDSNLNASMGGRELLKRGVSCSQDVLKLVAWGDGTQAAAAKQGGITEVVGLDFDNTAILGFIWTQNCTVVYGREAPAPAAAVATGATVEEAPMAPPPEPVMPAPTATAAPIATAPAAAPTPAPVPPPAPTN